MKSAAALAVLSAFVTAACFASVSPTSSPRDSPVPSPTAGPTATMADVPLELAIRIREAVGLRADADWVRQVHEAATSSISNLGILLTPAELDELAQIQLHPDDRSALIAYGILHAAEYGGLFLDPVTHGTVMLFTGNLDAHRAAVAQLPRGAGTDIRACQFTEAELMAVMDDVDAQKLAAEGIQLMSVGLDTMNNVVTLEAKAGSPDTKALLEARYGGKLVATIFPLPGAWAHRTEGDGWRLVAAVARDPNWAYRVAVATNDADWDALWAELSPGLEIPEFDFGTEIVAVFADGTGGPGSCDEVRFDDLVIDLPARLIFSRTSDPLAPRGCDLMLGGSAVFIVGLQREALPPTPFTIQLHERLLTGGDSERTTVDSL